VLPQALSGLVRTLWLPDKQDQLAQPHASTGAQPRHSRYSRGYRRRSRPGYSYRGPRRGCYVKLNGRQALVGSVILLPFVAQLLRYRRFSCLDHPKVNVAG
jgi:hypothetical protein